MSKRRKRKRKQKNKGVENTHHLCWPRRRWDSGYAHAIRQHWFFRIEIPAQTLHRTIHVEMSGIPVPDGAVAREAYEQVVLLEERGALSPEASIETRLSLLIALFDYAAQPTADGFKEQLEVVRRFKKASP